MIERTCDFAKTTINSRRETVFISIGRKITMTNALIKHELRTEY